MTSKRHSIYSSPYTQPLPFHSPRVTHEFWADNPPLKFSDRFLSRPLIYRESEVTESKLNTNFATFNFTAIFNSTVYTVSVYVYPALSVYNSDTAFTVQHTSKLNNSWGLVVTKASHTVLVTLNGK